jgi:hypothetical protein
MKNTEEIIFDTITNSAKGRFDYKSFKAVFREMGDDNMADSNLFRIIARLASGETKENLATELRTDMALRGYGFKEHYLEGFLERKEEELKAEIFATRFASSMLDQGTHPVTILNAVQTMLAIPPTGKPHEGGMGAS